jgi:methylase of polypeptide subunit release factors
MAVARHEPRQALDGGLRGTELLLGLVQSLGSQLAVDGTALLELDEGQGHELASTAAGVLGDARVTLIPDLAGRDRLLVIERGRHAG